MPRAQCKMLRREMLRRKILPRRWQMTAGPRVVCHLRAPLAAQQVPRARACSPALVTSAVLRGRRRSWILTSATYRPNLHGTLPVVLLGVVATVV